MMKDQKWFRTYLFIWAGQFVSMLTTYAVNFAVIIWLSLKYESAEVLAFSGIAGLLPQALIGPFAGVFIDRWSRKKTMIMADAFIAVCTFIMTFVLRDENTSLIWVYLLLSLRSLGTAFHAPAIQAIAPLIVPEKDLLRVSGINQMLQSVSTIAGPAVGALAITYLSISNVLYLDVIGAAAGIISLLMVTIPEIRTKAESSIAGMFTELKDGFRAIYVHRGLRFLFMYSMIATFFIMPIAILFPLITTGHYGGGKWEMSIVEIVWGIGMLIGGTVLGALRVEIRKVILVNTMHIILGLTFVLSGLFPSTWFIAFVVVCAIGGVAMSVFSAAFMTTIQEEIVPEMLGRVFSLYFSLAILPSLVGLLYTGFIAEIIGVANAFWISGVLMVGVGIASFLTPALMRLGLKVPDTNKK